MDDLLLSFKKLGLEKAEPVAQWIKNDIAVILESIVFHGIIDFNNLNFSMTAQSDIDPMQQAAAANLVKERRDALIQEWCLERQVVIPVKLSETARLFVDFYAECLEYCS